MNKIGPIQKLVQEIYNKGFNNSTDGKRALSEYFEQQAQAIYDAMWTTIISGDESTLPEEPTDEIEIIVQRHHNTYQVWKYIPAINSWINKVNDSPYEFHHDVFISKMKRHATRWMRIRG